MNKPHRIKILQSIVVRTAVVFDPTKFFLLISPRYPFFVRIIQSTSDALVANESISSACSTTTSNLKSFIISCCSFSSQRTCLL